MPDEIHISVDTSEVIADTSRRQIGINLNYLRDDNRNLPNARPIEDALVEMGVRYLRYPGGEKSDYYLWSLPPYDAPNPQVFDRRGEHGDSYKSGYAPGHHLLDFDGFMAVCLRVGAAPYVVIGATPIEGLESGPITMQQYMDNAVSWVRYANIVKKYGVKYWEIGNENWQSLTADDCADLAVRFSRAMKMADPAIKIGVSGNSRAYFETLLQKAGHDIDFLVASCYPCYEWRSYDYYAGKAEVNLIPSGVIEAIRDFGGGRFKDKIKVVAAEINSWDWSQDGWSTESNLGHALVTWEIFGQLLTNEQIDLGMLWTTRWMDYGSTSIANALGPRNQLNLPGMILKIWGSFLLDKMVAVDRTETLVNYASFDPPSGGLNLFLLNKSYRDRDITIAIRSIHEYRFGSVYRLQGSGPDDAAPHWSGGAEITLTKNEASGLLLPATSLTVVKLAIL